ncbi:MAG TPA: hypothetical protein VFQ45_15825 [Longimicrobium sp.]|nr:hypothetical protein [Longimicrobium sp.]
MRAVPLLALACLAAAPARAQAIAIPLRCHGDCPPPGRLPATLTLDSVDVSATLEKGRAITYVRHVFSHGTAGSIDAAFFFPLPADAVLHTVSVFQAGELETYNEWSRPEESRLILDGLARARPELRAYAGEQLVHVHLPSVPPGGTQHIQVGYTQPLGGGGGAIAYRYPLAAAPAPAGDLDIVLTVRTEHGFRDLHSPGHAVRVEWGTEMARCPPTHRCGYHGVMSHRVKIVRFHGGAEARGRDFEIVYEPAGAGEAEPLPSLPSARAPTGGRRGRSAPAPAAPRR